MRRARTVSITLFGFLFVFGPASCGESGSREVQPVEVLLRVSGIQGTAFTVNGLVAANAAHDLADARACLGSPTDTALACRTSGDCAGAPCEPTFTTPQLFVFENAFQPLRGTFRNLDPVNPIRIDIVAGTFSHAGELPPGQSCTFGTDLECIPATPCPDETASACAPAPTPVGPVGREARFEVYSLDEGLTIAFSAAIGDLAGSHQTTCAITPIAPTCQTPATFFLEEPSGSASGVFTKLAGQNINVRMRADLYIDGLFVDYAETSPGDGSDARTAVVSHDL